MRLTTTLRRGIGIAAVATLMVTGAGCRPSVRGAEETGRVGEEVGRVISNGDHALSPAAGTASKESSRLPTPSADDVKNTLDLACKIGDAVGDSDDPCQ